MTASRRAILAGATWTFRRPPPPPVTPEELDDLCRLAVSDPEPFPHMPDESGSRCERCGRPDWERRGPCLIALHAAANPLARASLELEAAADLVRDREDRRLMCALRLAANAIRDAGGVPFTDAATRLREQRARWAGRRSAP